MRSRRKDAYGHDHLWWLDRMVRTSRPLVERMALVWHDWFATSNATVGSQRLMLPGKYTLWCSLPGHRKLGMVAPLTVTT